MATRATYLFEADLANCRPAVCFYVHHDGYLEGAAEKFLFTLLHANERGGLAERFVRGNDNAEFTGSHQAHGDTEFRYTVNPDYTLLAEARVGYSNEWRTAFYGNLLDFIEAKNGDKLIRHRGRVYDFARSCQQVTERLEYVSHALANNWIGNASSSANDAWDLRCTMLKAYGSSDFLTQTDATIEAADRVFCSAYGWEAHHGDNAFTAWREQFRAE
jgi:hypothetical protein